MSHVTCTNESCHPHECVMSHIRMSMSHIRMSHVTLMNAFTHMNESCRTCVSYVTHTPIVVSEESVVVHTYEMIMSHIWMRHVTCTNESCHTCEWVMSHIRMCQVTHMNQSCHSHESVAVFTVADFRNTWRICLFVSSRWLYGVASVSRIDKIIGLFCKRALWKRRYSAQETYNLIDPTNRSHPPLSWRTSSRVSGRLWSADEYVTWRTHILHSSFTRDMTHLCML